ncbi:hypothetical protein BC567DRAFT_219041 [Phyllosticta citribraziliensis]
MAQLLPSLATMVTSPRDSVHLTARFRCPLSTWPPGFRPRLCTPKPSAPSPTWHPRRRIPWCCSLRRPRLLTRSCALERGDVDSIGALGVG